jgi:cytochrome c-type biogenesis protein CcmH
VTSATRPANRNIVPRRTKEAPVLSIAVLLLALTAQPAAQASTEATARRLEAELIAPCCWSQQVSVHQSPAADEIRKDLRVRLARGETEERILNDYVVQFGEQILAEPPARGFNTFLYVLPPVFLVAGAALVVLLVRRFSRQGATAPEEAPAAADSYQARLDDELRDLD